MAAVDLFLKIDGIAGESTDRAHPGEIETLAFSWAERQPESLGGGGGGHVGGRVQMGEINVVMRASAASPLLMLSCASARHHATATLSARRRGGRSREFLVLALKDVFVSSYRVGANESGEDDTPTDQVSIVFGQVTYTYTPVDAKGAPRPPVTASWDVVTNTSGAAPARPATRTRKKAP